MHIYKDFPLSEVLYYKIGGRAKFVLRIQSKQDLLEALDFIQQSKIQRILPIGLGSNLLLNDEPFDGAVLWFTPNRDGEGFSNGKDSIRKSEDKIEAFASAILDDVIQFSFANNLVGLEWAGGLPSTVGGAVRGNVGAFGGEIKNHIENIEVVDLNDSNLPAGKAGHLINVLPSSKLQFSYRDSLIKRNKNLLIVSAEFKLKKGTPEEVDKAKEVYKDHIAYRKKNHPMEYPSCGSVFKNIVHKDNVEKILSIWPDVRELSAQKWHNKIAMGYVINRLGFSNFRIGGAQVSTKHANYIVNVNKAKFTDIVSIISKIKQKFSSLFGFSPELELEIVE